MKIADLGPVTAPLLAFGGPASNLQAMEALIALGHPAGQALCTGDSVAYGADPAVTVAALRAYGCAVVAGNVEAQLAAGRDACGCGFGEGSACDLAARRWYAHAAAEIDAQARAWMAGLPEAVRFELGALRGIAIHGGARDAARFLWPSSPDAAFREEVDALEAVAGPIDLVVAGHCGLAFARTIWREDGARLLRWINAGVIGLPPHDGRPETRYALIDQAGHVVFHRLSYAYETAAAAMREAGLVQGYEDTLSTGIWPSQEVLPPELRRPD
ncbi:MAG: metallophosphoesterase [Pseudomonadota bacterium]